MYSKTVGIAHLFADDIEGIKALREGLLKGKPQEETQESLVEENESDIFLLNTYNKDGIKGWEYLKGNLLTLVFAFTGTEEETEKFINTTKETFKALDIAERGLGETLILEETYLELVDVNKHHLHVSALNEAGKIEYYSLFGGKHVFVNHLEKASKHINGFTWEEYFCKELPLLDAQLFALAQKAKYYKGQKKIILSEKKEKDNRIGIILHQNLKRENDDLLVAELENTIEELANIYGTLGSNSLVLQNAHTVIGEGISLTSGYSNRLFYNEENGFNNILLANYQQKLRDLNLMDEQLRTSLKNTQAAIEVVRTRVDIIRTKDNHVVQEQMRGMLKQNLMLMKEGLSLQVAAAFIEFIVINYYSLSIWKTLTDEDIFHHIPAWIKLVLIISFAGSATLLTHFVAENIQEKGKANKKAILVSLVMAAILGIMIFLSLHK